MNPLYALGAIIIAIMLAIAVFKAMDEIERGVPMTTPDRVKAKWENVGLAVLALGMLLWGLFGGPA